MWLPLENIKLGRLRLALTVIEINEKGPEEPFDVENENKRSSSEDDSSAQKELFSAEESPIRADRFEPIDIQGIQETGLWVHQPGSEFEQVSEHRKGKSRGLDIEIRREERGSDSIKSPLTGPYKSDCSCSDESEEDAKAPSKNRVKRGINKMKSIFQRSPAIEDKPNSMELPDFSPKSDLKVEGGEINEDNGPDSPSKRNVKGVTKSIMKHAGKSVRGIKHAFSKKGSRLSEDGAELAQTERDIHLGCESDEEESLPSLPHNHEVEEISSVISNPISSGSSDSVNLDDNIVQTRPTSPKMDAVEQVDEISVGGCESVEDKPLGVPVGIGDALGKDCLDSKVSEEKMLVEEQ